MSNIDKLSAEKKANVERALKAGEAAALKAAVQAPANEPATVIPNTAKRVTKAVVDSIKVITVPLPARKPAEAEVITGPTPYTKAKAEALDKRIVATVTGIGDGLDKLEKLVGEAKDGQIHIALGFASWTAYFADRVSTPFAAIGDRQIAALMLHEEGMSNRAIGSVLGVSPATVVSDVRTAKGKQPATVEPKAPATTTGRDGKTYTRKPTANKPAPQPKPKPAPEPVKKRTPDEQLIDIAFADAENIVTDLETLTLHLEKVYAKASYKHGDDKAIRALITKARKLIGDLPKAPARPKTANG